MMRQTDQQHFRAAIAYGYIKDAGGVLIRNPGPPAPAPSGYLTLSSQGAVVLEYQAGAEVIARKVETSSGEVFWLRADLALLAEAALAYEVAERDRIIREVCDWRDKMDAENAARRGMTVEAYRKLRNAQGHRQMMKSGVNSIGMR
jgi:hypothetical protein